MLQKAIFTFLVITIGFGKISGQNTDFPPQPNPPRLVTDFTLTLGEEEKRALEQKLSAYADSTSSHIAIVAVKDIGDYDIGSYAVELAMQWGIGVKGKNNGILILWATGNRKIYIATGYGMEEKVPDAIAKRIVNQIIIPSFREGQYYQGLNMATDEIMARMSGTFEAEGQAEEGFPFSFFIMLLLMFLLFMYIANKNRGKGNGFNNRNRGGFGGWGGGVYPPWTIGNGGGYSGGWDSNNSSGWGGGGGGGFGGFGGGDFGGGGAGGDY